jgi:hypothetical protein
LSRTEDVFPSRLICGVIYHPSVDLEQLFEQLEKSWGKRDSLSTQCPFSEGSQYYCDQMGSVHHRLFISFCELVHPDDLAQIKHQAIVLEEWASHQFPGVLRPINLDPGLIMRGRMVLATTKDFSHRIYIGMGMYAEVTLQISKKGVKYLDWTYPDIKEGHYDTFFKEEHRKLYDLSKNDGESS